MDLNVEAVYTSTFTHSCTYDDADTVNIPNITGGNDHLRFLYGIITEIMDIKVTCTYVRETKQVRVVGSARREFVQWIST